VDLPSDYLPISHDVHPSTVVTAPVLSENSPTGQFRGMHAVISPPVDYVPAKHCSHPSVEYDAPFLVAYSPALHSDLLHVKSEPKE